LVNPVPELPADLLGLVRSGALLDVELTKDTPITSTTPGPRRPGHRPISLVEYCATRRSWCCCRIWPSARTPGAVVNLVAQKPLSASSGWRSGRHRARPCCCPMWLAEVHGVRPEYFTAAELTAMLLEADAACSSARRAAGDLRGTRAGLDVYDWVRCGVSDRVADGVRRLGRPAVLCEAHPGWSRTCTRRSSQPDDALAHVDRWPPRPPAGTFDPATLARYFRTLDFSLGPAVAG